MYGKRFKKGITNPNRKTSSGVLPIGTAVNEAEMILERKSAYPDIQEITKKDYLKPLIYLSNMVRIRKNGLIKTFGEYPIKFISLRKKCMEWIILT